MGESMNNILIRISLSGIKNIENKISIDFYDQTINKKISKASDKVKVIYGSNGTGKSAIMNAIDLYLKINSSNYLSLQKDNIKKLINIKTKKFYFKIVFASCSNDLIEKVYSHEIEIQLFDDNPIIALERMSVLNDQTINGEFKLVYENKNGELYFPDEENDLYSLFKDKTKNLLLFAPLSSMLISNKEIMKEVGTIINQSNSSGKANDLIISLLCLSSLTMITRVYLDDKDKHNIVETKVLLESLQKIMQKMPEMNFIDSQSELVLRKNFQTYEIAVKRLEKFLKLFKSNLKEIKLIKRIEKDFYHCSKQLIYNDYSIDSEYESNGIKKIMKIFSYLDSAVEGQIVFIDELDSNISSVYLNKFIEYFLEYGKGILCFTSHNFEFMNVLTKGRKRAIYFLGETGILRPWVQEGNTNVVNSYKDGMIEDSPYNIEAYEFIKVFESGDE